MPAKKKLTLVQSPGELMVTAIIEEMRVAGVQPDAKEAALLSTASTIVDRLAALQALIARDGELLTADNGVVRVHPAVAEYRQYAATLPKVLAGVVVGDTATGIVKDPVKQRAVNVRWAAQRLRESQARLAGGL